MSAVFTIDRALTDPRLLGAALGDPHSWATWLIVLKAAFGLPLTDEQLAVFISVAGNRKEPSSRVREMWCLIGRRGGKSRVAAALAVYFSLFVKHKLARGERAMCLVLAASQEQAKVVFGYCKAFVTESAVLGPEADTITQHEIRLRNGITIAVHANSFRSVRGRTVCACIFDEVAFWRDETTATPDTETYTAVLPSLVTTNGMLIGISTPYKKMGLLHQKHSDHFGIDSHDVLVVQGSSQTFNPSLSETAIAAQRAADPIAALAEWDAEFRHDISAFLDDQTIEQAIEFGRPLELPPVKVAQADYHAFADASGGVGQDSYTVAVGHKEGDRCIIDLVRGTSGKFDPQEVTKQYANLMKEYHVRSVTGDAYAAQWVAGAWDAVGVSYDKSELPESQIYLEVAPLFARGLVRLPDHPRLLRELRLLERHTHRSGRDTVDHGRNGRDDYANAVCGVLHSLSNYSGYDWSLKWVR